MRTPKGNWRWWLGICIGTAVAAVAWNALFGDKLDVWGTFFTLLTATGTIWLARETVSMAEATVAEARRATGFQLFHQQVEMYQSVEMRKLRQSLANALASYQLPGLPIDPVSEDSTVLDFFENLAHLIRNEAIDKNVAWNYFSDAVRCYWHACERAILPIRKTLQQPDLYEDFEWLSGEFAYLLQGGGRGKQPKFATDGEAKRFLKAESKLKQFN